MADVRTEARLNNRRAVQRLFDEKRSRPATAAASSGSGGLSSFPFSGSIDIRPSSSSRPPPAITLSGYYAAASAGGGGGGGWGGQSRQQQQQPWVTVSRRGCVLEPSLDVASHLSQQLQLSAELAVAYGRDGVSNGISGGAHGEEDRALLARAALASTGAANTAGGPVGDPRRSCFALHVAKHQHRVELSPSHGAATAAAACQTQRDRDREQSRLYHRQQAVLRNETALARKRAAYGYTGLIAAQADASCQFPNAHTLDLLVARRYSHQQNHQRQGWVLDNPHRQQLLRGEPVMTQVMRGDFYESPRGRAASGSSNSNNVNGRSRSVADAQRVNRRDVRVASAINSSVRRTRSCQREARRNTARGGCYCPVPAAAAAAAAGDGQ